MKKVNDACQLSGMSRSREELNFSTGGGSDRKTQGFIRECRGSSLQAAIYLPGLKAWRVSPPPIARWECQPAMHSVFASSLAHSHLSIPRKGVAGGSHVRRRRAGAFARFADVIVSVAPCVAGGDSLRFARRGLLHVCRQHATRSREPAISHSRKSFAKEK